MDQYHVHHQQSTLIVNNISSNASYYFDGRGLQLYKGYIPLIFGFTQLFLLLFCLFISILHLSGLRIGFVIFLCLSIANVVLADMVTDSVFNEEKYNYAEWLGMDRVSARQYVRVIAPMMHMFNVLFGSFLFMLGWAIGNSQRESQAAAQVRGAVWNIISGISGIWFILIFPMSYGASYIIAQRTNGELPIAIAAFMLIVGPIMPCCYYAPTEGLNWKEQEICRRRQTMSRYMVSCMLIFTVFTIPYSNVPFDFSPLYELLRRIFLFLQIFMIPYYVRYSTFSYLPHFLSPLKRDRESRLPPFEYYDCFEIVTRKGLLFSILRNISDREGHIECTPTRESVELSRISRKGAVYSDNGSSQWY